MLPKSAKILLLLAIVQAIDGRHRLRNEPQWDAADDLEGEPLRISRRDTHAHAYNNPEAESELEEEPAAHVHVDARDVRHTHAAPQAEAEEEPEPVQVARRQADAGEAAEEEHMVAPRAVAESQANEFDAGEPVQVATRGVLEDYKADCNQGHLMLQRKKIPIQSPFYGKPTPYPGKMECDWQLTGDKDGCIVEVVCPDMDLKDSPDCDGEYVEISDGIGGRERFCGKKSFTTPVKATRGFRDLFVRFKSADTGTGRKGFNCQARCSANIGAAKELAVTQKRKEEPRCVCGLQNKDDRIVGGQDAKMNEFPWQVAVVLKGTRSPKCGGAFINDRYILTAAHCFALEGQGPHEIEILFHVQSLDMTLQDGWKDIELGKEGSIRSRGYKDPKKTDKDEKTQRFTVTKMINNPLFTPTYDYDVSILRVEPAVDLSHPDAPTPICLPELSYNEQYVGKSPWVVGWGLADEKAGGTTRLLQKLDVPVIEFSKCASWTTSPLTNRMLCAGYEEGKRDACTGDSGGPLSLKKANNQWEQIGIVSWGEGCAQAKKPGYYSRVTELQQFIRYHTSDAKWCKDTKG